MTSTNIPVTQKNLLIIGGSYSGISTAHYLLKHVVPDLSTSERYSVVLVSTSSQAICRPACPRAMISDAMFPQEKLFVDINEQFGQYPESTFSFIQATATELDHGSRTVSVQLVTGGLDKIPFHSLIIATGSTAASPLNGFSRGEDHLRASWAEFRKALPIARHIVIAGGGPTGVETAGELGEYLNGSPRWFKSSSNPKVVITLVTADSRILPNLRPAISKTAEEYLTKLGVNILRNSKVVSVVPEGAGTRQITSPATLTLSDGKTLDVDLYMPATGTRPNTGFVPPSLLTPNGRIDTDTTTLRVDKAGPRIYAVGDVASYSRPAIHIILEAVPILCANIKHDLLLSEGRAKGSIEPERTFKEDLRETQLVVIGRSKGVGAFMGYRMPSFVVWLIKGRDYWLWTTGNLWSGKQWNKKS